jgi:hypothetical protein
MVYALRRKIVLAIMVQEVLKRVQLYNKNVTLVLVKTLNGSVQIEFAQV